MLAWFFVIIMQNHAGPKNMCKEAKKNRRRTELDGGVYLPSRVLWVVPIKVVAAEPKTYLEFSSFRPLLRNMRVQNCAEPW
jgi:hypothetical protein